MAQQITLMKGKHTVKTSSAIEAENLKGIGYRVIKQSSTSAARPDAAKPTQDTQQK